MERDYSSNSYKSKAESEETQKKKEVKSVVKGKVKTKKSNRLTDVFISEDVRNVKSYVFMDVLVPAIKKAIYDIVTDGISMTLFGDTAHKKSNRSGSKVSYRSYSDDRRDRDRDRSDSRYSYDELILETRGEAEDVLQQLDDIIDEYGSASVADLYDLCDLTGSHTDNKYGWKNLDRAEPRRTRDGWKLDLPRPRAL